MQYKESELKNKIFSYQVHEKTTDHKTISKKLSLNQQLIEENNKKIKEKDHEIYQLSTQIKAIKSHAQKGTLTPVGVREINEINKERSTKPKISIKNNKEVVHENQIENEIDGNTELEKKNSFDENYKIKAQENKGIDV